MLRAIAFLASFQGIHEDLLLSSQLGSRWTNCKLGFPSCCILSKDRRDKSTQLALTFWPRRFAISTSAGELSKLLRTGIESESAFPSPNVLRPSTSFARNRASSAEFRRRHLDYPWKYGSSRPEKISKEMFELPSVSRCDDSLGKRCERFVWVLGAEKRLPW